ncbi:hypothetical protein L3X38_003628 [Prunus dulcis]|uniref:Uncharacterized protein n=1 Tax=Prunus dulcis TaxID=3755 RepID=A0AAD4ZMD6_PRUDU|nr:hypothetical protein L3X38_003628 [Prunus dulcis]
MTFNELSTVGVEVGIGVELGFDIGLVDELKFFDLLVIYFYDGEMRLRVPGLETTTILVGDHACAAGCGLETVVVQMRLIRCFGVRDGVFDG